MRRADLLAILILIASTIVASRDLFLDPVRTGLDTLSFFWPAYAFLGDQLRSGNVPGWNPYQFSGVPFAADPETGWMYVPAMVVFILLPVAVAIKVYALAHILIVAGGTYVYGRVIGLIPAGALVSAWAVSQGGLFSDRARCCYAHIQVAAWIPLVLLGVEFAVRATRHRPRMLAWLLCAFAISQMLAGWIGQGSMYGLLLFGAYVLFRTLLHPADRELTLRSRVLQAAQHGAIPILVGVGVAALGILPRLAHYRESNLAGGYTGSAAWAAQVGGWSFGRQLEEILRPSGWFIVAIVIALGVVAVRQPRSRYFVGFFLALTITGFTLGLERHTPLHQVLFTLLPLFEEMHTHYPERIALIFMFGPAMLAGIGLTALLKHPNAASLASSVIFVSLAALGLRAANLDLNALSWIAIISAIILLAMLAIAILTSQTRLYRILAVVILASVVIELQSMAQAHLEDGNFTRVDATSISEKNETAEIITAGDPEVPPRFFGYDPSVSTLQEGELTYYRHHFEDELTAHLLVNNRGTLWQVADIQGYNPLQLQGYVAYMEALNHAPQEYHGANILPGGIDSPLLRLLAPEFVVIPRVIPPGRPDLQALVERYPRVASTSQAQILRVTDAFPRAWIVHEVQPFDGDLQAAVSEDAVDFRQVALVEDQGALVTSLDAPSGTVTERATITDYSPDSLTVDVTSDGDGLLVLSETYAEGWTATIDGADGDVVAVNGALRGVPVPDGSHAIVLSFESPGLAAGYGVGIATTVLIGGGLIAATVLDRRSTRARASTGEPPGSQAGGRPALSPASPRQLEPRVARPRDHAVR